MKDRIYMNIAQELSLLSKCQFMKVAAIAVDDSGRIKATGVNGTVSGMVNCCDMHFDTRDDHKLWSDDYELHAEMNMIEDLARSGYMPSTLTIYVTHSPCRNCLKHLVGLVRLKGSAQVHIDKIVYDELYHRLTVDDVSDMKNYCSRLGVRLESIQESEREFQS